MNTIHYEIPEGMVPTEGTTSILETLKWRGCARIQYDNGPEDWETSQQMEHIAHDVGLEVYWKRGVTVYVDPDDSQINV